jgi:hypothetical protein
VLQLISSIFEYAVAEEICEHSPCQGLSKTLSARRLRIELGNRHIRDELIGYIDPAPPARVEREIMTLPDTHAVYGIEVETISRLHIERVVPGVDVSDDAIHPEH